jgi:PAS domain S-box-containing protein
MIEPRSPSSAARPSRDFDALAAAARRAVRGRRTQREALNSYIATLHVATLVADDAGCYIGANDEACHVTGYSRDELLTLSVAQLTAPEDANPGERLWNSFVRSDYQRGSFSIRRKDGTALRVVYHAYTDIAEGMHVSFLVADDADTPGA